MSDNEGDEDDAEADIHGNTGQRASTDEPLEYEGQVVFQGDFEDEDEAEADADE